jgi:hypothetical protein
MVSKVDQTVDFQKKKAVTFNCCFIFQKGSSVAPSRLLTLGVVFLPFSLPLPRWNRRKSPQNRLVLSPMSTVDYVADQRAGNSWHFQRNLTEVLTMVSKVDRTVDFHPTIFIQDFSSNDCRLLKKKKILRQSIYDQKSTVDSDACFIRSMHSWNFKHVDNFILILH